MVKGICMELGRGGAKGCGGVFDESIVNRVDKKLSAGRE
jgi:hypothetical protein